MTTLDITTECAGCAANRLKICKLKKWNLIAICACCILGAGGIGLSLYFYRKHARFRRSLDELNDKIDALTRKMTTRVSRKSQTKSVTFKSNESESDSYDTPSQSPTRSSQPEITHQEPVVFLSDNRSLELLQMQTNEDKLLICQNNQNKFEKVNYMNMFFFIYLNFF